MRIRIGRGFRGSVAGGLALALVVVAAGCGGDARADDDAQGAGSESSEYQRVINVEVTPLAETGFREEIRLTGVVRASRDVTISAEEAGVIREIVVDRGRTVAEGDDLFRIDDRILQSQLREAEARASLARETWERRRRLFEEDQVGSELAYLEARYSFEQAEAALETLRERADRGTIRAPFAGVLESREVEVGTSVAPGTEVARIVQIDPVKISAGAPERFAGRIRPGSEVNITFDVLPGETFAGTMSYVGATVNARNRTFEVEVVLPNPGRVAMPEMVANMEVTLGTRESVIVVPQNTVVRTEDGFVAFVAEAGPGGEEVARVRQVRLGSSRRNQVIVEEGLSAGDRLIVVGHQQVADGDRIRIVRTRDGADG